jgi:hypothetical protein
MRDDHTDRQRKALGLGKPFGGVEIVTQRLDVRTQDKSPRTAGDLVLELAVKAQSSAP